MPLCFGSTFSLNSSCGSTDSSRWLSMLYSSRMRSNTCSDRSLTDVLPSISTWLKNWQWTERDTGVRLLTHSLQKSLQAARISNTWPTRTAALVNTTGWKTKCFEQGCVWVRNSHWWCRAQWPEPSFSAELWPGHMLVYSDSAQRWRIVAKGQRSTKQHNRINSIYMNI